MGLAVAQVAVREVARGEGLAKPAVRTPLVLREAKVAGKADLAGLVAGPEDSLAGEEAARAVAGG